MAGPPRYNGLADWYDQEVRRLSITPAALRALTRLLGPGPGKCLDVGCGTGIAIPSLNELGWAVAGIDISADQLRIARRFAGEMATELVEADATKMPFAAGSFDAVVSLWTHTDFDQPEAVFRESRRVLRPGGRFVYVGTHPCFVNPFSERLPTGMQLLHPGYRTRGWALAGPGFGQGIRPRVGVNHLPLAALVNAVIEAGLTLEHLEEPGEEDYPTMLCLVAER